MDIEFVRSRFIKHFDGKTGNIYASPGRINLIGEHTDYNGGFVFPGAVDCGIMAEVRPNGTNTVMCYSIDLKDRVEFKVDDPNGPRASWARYIYGMVQEMRKLGVDVKGFNTAFAGDVPLGAGMSSSAALESCFAYALNDLFGNNKVSKWDMVLAGQATEHNYCGVNCGIMDQFIIAMGKKNTAIVLDCNTLEYEYAPLELGDYRFVVMNTNKQRRLADSKYNERRSQCEQALALLKESGLKINALCELTPEEWEASKAAVKDEILQKRAKHCIYENARVLAAVKALNGGDLKKLGALLNESHESLKTDYEVTGIELDTLAETAQKQEGCLGARMTGAGFGGCGIALVHKDNIDSFVKNVQDTYTKTIGYNAGFFACESGDGVAKM